ncbi:hypothetical protein DL93DRAFT_1117151 [Clavulina sp. PMI_390]|nr:hypothetical protein DL93DRAFT_1117151 [Clavulina sp. PMI_390]
MTTKTCKSRSSPKARLLANAPGPPEATLPKPARTVASGASSAMVLPTTRADSARTAGPNASLYVPSTSTPVLHASSADRRRDSPIYLSMCYSRSVYLSMLPGVPLLLHIRPLTLLP